MIKKSPTPIIWIDTSVLINLANLAQGKDGSNPNRDRLLTLKSNIIKFTRDCKLLCPEGTQGTEYFRVNDDLFSSTQSQLSMGVKAKHPKNVESAMMNNAMDAFHKEAGKVEFSYSDVFFSDPIAELKKANSQNVFITSIVRHTDEGIKKLILNRSNIYAQWEQLRKRQQLNRISYNEQLEHEFRGEARVLFEDAIRCVEHSERNVKPSDNEIYSYLALSRLTEQFQLFAECNSSDRSFAQFLDSEYYRSVPSIDVSARLIASLMTGDSKIKNGDHMDVEHVSAFLPVANLMLLDKAMRSRVRRLGLDKKYNTVVCYIGDDTELETFFGLLA